MVKAKIPSPNSNYSIYSNWGNMKYQFPQGSIYGPLVFLIMFMSYSQPPPTIQATLCALPNPEDKRHCDPLE
jgi:hypothetical protein